MYHVSYFGASVRGGGTILKVGGPGLKKLMSGGGGGGGGLPTHFRLQIFLTFIFNTCRGSPPTCPTSVVTSKKKKRKKKRNSKSGWATGPPGPPGSAATGFCMYSLSDFVQVFTDLLK